MGLSYGLNACHLNSNQKNISWIAQVSSPRGNVAIGQKALAFLLLAIPHLVFGQTTPANPSKVPNDAATDVQSATSANPCRRADAGPYHPMILSDTMGMDFGPYVKQIVSTVRRSWQILLPSFEDAAMHKADPAAVVFLINRDGKVDIDDITILISSGASSLDRLARGSIVRSDPFPPLPKEFPVQSVRVRLYFSCRQKSLR
jgi:TonB family protein